MRIRGVRRVAALLLSLAVTVGPGAGAISVEEARDILRDNYIDEIPEDILSLPTIDEITNALGDPYTYYMTPEQYQEFQVGLGDTDVVGIGVMVEKLTDGLKVTGIAPDSPAEKAGIQAGDVIVAAQGITIEQAGSPETLASHITGEEGEKVTIALLRDGEELELTLTRAAVVFPTVTGQVVDGHIGWLDCTSFGENSGAYFETYINEESAAADRWVVDLRGNPGGYAPSVIEAVGHVMGNRVVAYLRDKSGAVSYWVPNPYAGETDGLIQEPLIVLVDGNSASASELFAAAIRDYHYGLIIGTRTFGKGIAQNVLEQEDGSAIRVTTQRYYSPDYVTPDRSGVLPHLVVDASLADEVAMLLSGGEEGASAEDVLTIHLAYRDWYVHRDTALSEKYSNAFSELLSALAPDTPITLDGNQVTPDQAADAWGVEFTSRSFDDVDSSPYALQINALSSLGVLQGTGDGTFVPEGELTRAELTALICQAMGYWCWESEKGLSFTDVSGTDWFASSVEIASNLGFIQGNEKGEFAPDMLIDTEQYLTILARMGERADLTIGQRLGEITQEELSRPEVQNFNSWAQAAAVTADSLGFLTGPLSEMDPHKPVTREEAAVILYQFLDYTGILTPAGE